MEGRLRGLYTAASHGAPRYAADPVELAAAYQRAGARWLHLVDLDAARDGGWTLGPLLERLRGSTGLRIQSGGGVRSEADV